MPTTMPLQCSDFRSVVLIRTLPGLILPVTSLFEECVVPTSSSHRQHHILKCTLLIPILSTSTMTVNEIHDPQTCPSLNYDILKVVSHAFNVLKLPNQCEPLVV